MQDAAMGRRGDAVKNHSPRLRVSASPPPLFRRLLLAATLFAITALSAYAGARPPAPRPAEPTPPPPAAPAAFATPPPTLEIPDDTRPFTANPAGGGIKVDTDPEEELAPYTGFPIFFPEPMIPADQIDSEDAPSPIVTWPDLDATFSWRTQSEGYWMVDGPRIPGQTYRLRLRDDLKDLAGNPLPTADWGIALHAPALTVTEDYGERERLSSRPQVPLEFNYPMRLHDAAEGIWFQDRASREKFPCEVLLNVALDDQVGDAVDVTTGDLPIPTEFRVRPRDPLPVGRFYDLIVEAPRDAYAGRTLPYPRVFPLGRTRPLTVDYVAARNWPADKPHIEIKFTVPLGDDPLPADALAISPEVPNLRLRKEGQLLLADGDFNTAQRYKVTVSDQIRGDRGYPLAEKSVWGATFHPKKATILFPEGVIRQRSALGLRFALLQANTGPITWKLARVPLQQLEEIETARSQLIERGEGAPLIPQFNLEVAAQGELPASFDDKEEFRAIEWQPANHQSPITSHQPLSGPFFLEATAADSKGGVISNSALIFFNETVFTRKAAPESVWLRLASMATGEPLPGIPVRVVTRDLVDIAAATTGPDGTAEFPAIALTGSSYFIADTPGGPSIELTKPGAQFSSGSFYRSSPEPSFLGSIVTDRPLYRPGQEVKFKGFLREKENGGLEIPSGRQITWEILAGYRDEVITSGTVAINAFGGWDASWTTPEQGKLGNYRIRCKLDGREAGSPATFQIEEYRNPAFSVVCEELTPSKAAESTIKISSQYFHGAPNVGSAVKWTATWISDHDGDYYFGSDEEDGFIPVDLYSENAPTPSFEAEVEGEAVLDANGTVTLTSTAPFRDPGNRAGCTVLWQADITGPDGQTISGGINQSVVMNDVTLGVRADPDSGVKDIAFDLRAIPRKEGLPVPEKVEANLFLVSTKTVKERIAPFVYRYRNTDAYTSIERKEVAATGRLEFTPTEPGRYVLVVSPLAGLSGQSKTSGLSGQSKTSGLPGQSKTSAGGPGIPVSEEIYLSGPGEAELPIRSDETLTVQPVKKDAPALAGTPAAFQVLTPSPGIAWVTVETDRILDAFTMEIDGNSNRIEIPVKAEYTPNAFVSVYLLRPGRTDALPGEMFGHAELRVLNPASELNLAVSTDRPDYEPRQTARGEVRVTANGQPVANAEVVVYAVDDSVLQLGGWTLPGLLPAFYPQNQFAVITYLALTGYVQSFSEKSLTQKEMVVGGGGKDEFGNTEFVRKDFRPLILWLPSLQTGADGVARFECETPDNLTRFRVIALGQTKENQFGSGDTAFTVSKPLLLEPALPRFLRQGDEVELRVVARQKASDSEKLAVTCETEDGIELIGPATVEVTAGKDQPNVVRFKARAAADATSATVRFRVTSGSKLSDSVEIALPIASRTIQVSESVAGEWKGNEFSAAAHEPESWMHSQGTADLTLSTSPYLTKLLGIPVVLDYPHGCFEQKSSRLLVYTALAKLLAYLPQPKERAANYRKTIEDTFREFETSLLPDDTLPYWPYGTEGSPYVTIQTAWAVAQAQQAGYTVPETLAGALPRTLEQMIERKSRVTVSPTLRAFALFARSQFGEDPTDELKAAAEDLFLIRDRLTAEGRAMLAIAFFEMGILPERQRELVKELPSASGRHAFNSETFSSPTREEAICAWARLLITPDDDPGALKTRLEKIMASSASLSTQENLWLLIAFNSLLSQKPPAALPDRIAPSPAARSADGSAAVWAGLDLEALADLSIRNLGKSGTFVLAARRALPPDEQKPVDKGMRIERVARNLTDSARAGTAEAPFKIGDQILISYRLYSAQPQSFVALEDALPAGLETVNPNLALFGKTYQIPDDPNTPTAWLSYSEMRDRQTNLYFDEMAAGAQQYSVLARATAAGTFSWPSTQIAPMYDTRFHGRSAPSTCVVTK